MNKNLGMKALRLRQRLLGGLIKDNALHDT
jgi:hypothetical protein